jgi:NAD(P)H-hydrate epimerase
VVRTVTRVPRLPARARDAHKGTFGTVLIVAGSTGMLGAAILAARGALRGGAGLVRACLPNALRAPFTVAVPGATTLARSGAPRAWCKDADALVAGPGLGATAATRAAIRALLGAARGPCVLDADALNVLAPLRRALPRRAPLVLTPHPGEAGRLLGSDAKTVQADREGAALALSARAGHVVVLKGARTLVTDGARLFRNTTGNPGMASGGSGDVLAGLLGALLAQGMEPFDAACLGVHAHGAAGDLVARRLSQAGLIAEDLPLAIAEVLGR